MVRLLVIAGLVGAIAGACNPGVSTGSGSSGPAPVPDTGAPASGGGGGSAADGGSGGQQGGGASTDGGSSTESGSPATDGGTGTAADGAALPTAGRWPCSRPSRVRKRRICCGRVLSLTRSTSTVRWTTAATSIGSNTTRPTASKIPTRPPCSFPSIRKATSVIDERYPLRMD